MTAAGRSPARKSVPRPSWRSVAIVGVGLIGGSLGLALRKAQAAQHIIGVGPNKASLQVAKRRGAIDQGTSDLKRAVKNADLVVICTPVGMVAPLAIDAANHCSEQCVITDAGSTKSAIVGEISSARGDGRFPSGVAFVGGHPIAGRGSSGPAAAETDLFQDRRVILTPERGKNTAAVRKVTAMWQATGATVSCMSPADHDCLLAASSHLPHVVAAALSATLNARERKHSAGGLADTTRIASGDPKLWLDILQTNAAEVIAVIDRFQIALKELRESIAGDDQRKLTNILRKAKRNRDAL
ncbi:MAG: prephenate dehydrogenase/arogenate dehydrogenase family protein [Pirellulales bacterium]|nr:prephenate dehydrogenase/arogenate dehydrogenase family protein [Pirellulales bacterium]